MNGIKIDKKTIFSFLIVIAILVFLFYKVDLNEIKNYIVNINVGYYILGLLIFYLSFIPRGLRWNLLLKNIDIKKKTKDVTEIYFISWFANLIVPAKLGDLYRSHLFKKNFDHSKSKILGTIFMERFIDIIFLILFMTLSGFMIFREQFSETISKTLTYAYILLIVIIILFILLKKLRIKLANLLPEKFRHVILDFEKSASSCVKKGNLTSLITITVIYWILESATLYYAAKALNVDLSFYIIIFVTLFSAIISTIPLTPSGAGIAEVGVTGVLFTMGLDYNLALAIALVHRSIDYWSGLVIGSFVYAKSKLK